MFRKFKNDGETYMKCYVRVSEIPGSFVRAPVPFAKSTYGLKKTTGCALCQDLVVREFGNQLQLVFEITICISRTIRFLFFVYRFFPHVNLFLNVQ